MQMKEIDLNATSLTCNNHSLLFDSRQTTKEELQTKREREYSVEIVKKFLDRVIREREKENDKTFSLLYRMTIPFCLSILFFFFFSRHNMRILRLSKRTKFIVCEGRSSLL